MIITNDIILIHVDEKPGFYARVEEISPDVKPGWWQVKLLVLTFPLQVFTWTLDEYQMEGAPFTMGGTPLRLEELVSPAELDQVEQELVEQEKEKEEKARKAKMRQESGATKVISLQERRKK